MRRVSWPASLPRRLDWDDAAAAAAAVDADDGRYGVVSGARAIADVMVTMVDVNDASIRSMSCAQH